MSGLWRFNESAPDADNMLQDSSGNGRKMLIVNCNTRYGPGQPILYLSLYSGKPRIMLYNSSGSLILDKTVTPSFSLVNGGWYFIAGAIEPNSKQFTYVVGDRGGGEVWKSEVLTFTGELNRSCVADLVMGMHADTYYYAGGFDDCRL